ncbi:MAG: GHKL domain-containing protein [Lachnospiraceae bacterium]|nr:GHKL domain-containing protein [Lachnospiraceae bacterium]MCM1236358.1 GHKL domain-containing protein [Ruminococcus flavefaciens]
MEKILTVIFYILMIVEYATFYYTVFRKKEWRVYKRSEGGKLLLAGIGLCGIVCIGGFMEWYSGFELAPALGGTLLAMYLLFQMSFSDGFRMWLIAFLILSILELAGNSLLKAFSTWNEIGRSILYTVGITILLCIYYTLIGKDLSEDDFQLSPKMWRLIAWVLFILVLMMSLLEHLLEKTREESTVFIGTILLSVSAPILIILIFFMVYYFNHTQKYQLETEILEDYNDQQKEYFIGLLRREQETKKFRHDIENELLQLRHYFECENYEQLGNYLSDMMGEMKSIHGKDYDVGNDIVNTIINYYFHTIENTTIQVSGYCGEDIFVSQRDLCILISNLVKNAVEAIMLLDVDKYIQFRVERGKQYLGFHIENSIEGERYAKDNKISVTTKADRNNHGIGLRNVREVVKKYAGWYQQEIRGTMYVVDVQLKNMTVHGEK